MIQDAEVFVNIYILWNQEATVAAYRMSRRRLRLEDS